MKTVICCYIVKNESENIEESVASFRRVFGKCSLPKVAIFDTGSTDDTLAKIIKGKLAEALITVSKEGELIGLNTETGEVLTAEADHGLFDGEGRLVNFAEARNQCLWFAKEMLWSRDGTGYFWMDGDDVLEGEIDPKFLSNTLLRMDYVYVTEDGTEIGSINKARYFPRISTVSWRDPVHEFVYIEFPEKHSHAKSDTARVVHKQYLREGKEDRLLRNLRILESCPEMSGRMVAYKGRTLFEYWTNTGQEVWLEKALATMTDWRINHATWGPDSNETYSFFLTLVEIYLSKNLPHAAYEVLKHISVNLEGYGLIFMGTALFALGHMQQAKEAFSIAEKRMTSKNYYSYIFGYGGMDRFISEQALAHFFCGEIEKSIDICKKGLQKYPGNGTLRENLKYLLRGDNEPYPSFGRAGS